MTLARQTDSGSTLREERRVDLVPQLPFAETSSQVLAYQFSDRAPHYYCTVFLAVVLLVVRARIDGLRGSFYVFDRQWSIHPTTVCSLACHARWHTYVRTQRMYAHCRPQAPCLVTVHGRGDTRQFNRARWPKSDTDWSYSSPIVPEPAPFFVGHMARRTSRHSLE
jgi:hypothetical protein